MPSPQAKAGYRVTVGIRHYVASESCWEDRGEVELPATMVERFVTMLKKYQPGTLEKIK